MTNWIVKSVNGTLLLNVNDLFKKMCYVFHLKKTEAVTIH